MKDVTLPVTCKQLGRGLMILPLPILLLGLFIENGIVAVVGALGLVVDAIILFSLLLEAWATDKLPRFPIRCKCDG